MAKFRDRNKTRAIWDNETKLLAYCRRSVWNVTLEEIREEFWRMHNWDSD